MKLPYLTHPHTGQKDPMLTLTVIAVGGAMIRFLLDGVTFHYNGTPVSLGHMDSMSFGTLLTPILGAHGYMQTRNTQGGVPINDGVGSANVEVDRPE